MLTMSELAKQRVYVPRKPSRRDQKAGVEPEPKKLGRVHDLVFAPNGKVVVGIMVKRPDIAGMVKQEDRFVALDALEMHEGGLLVTGGEESFDQAACKRLGLDLDVCYIWSGMDVETASGKYLGHVMDARFNEKTGAVDCFCAQEGSTASALVGYFEIPAAWFVRYDRNRMVVREEAATMGLSGGLAAKAGEGYANAKEGAKRATAEFDEKASVAVEKGSHALGGVIGKAKAGLKRATGDILAESAPAGSTTAPARAARPAETSADKAARAARPSASTADKAARAVGEQLGKTKGMFSGFMREFKDASK